MTTPTESLHGYKTAALLAGRTQSIANPKQNPKRYRSTKMTHRRYVKGACLVSGVKLSKSWCPVDGYGNGHCQVTAVR